MFRWCYRHPLRFCLCYAAFYLIYFFLLEGRDTEPVWIVHCSLDDVIPFCKYAIIPYYLWFAWIFFTLGYFLFKGPRKEFWRLCLPLFAGMTLSLTFCAFVPNGLQLRPPSVAGDDIFSVLVRGLYRVDTSTNVFPSIHVFNSVTLDLAYQRSACFQAPRRRWVRWAALILDLSIIASTLLLKQHSVLDAAAGFLLAVALEILAVILSRKYEKSKERFAG